MYSRCPGGMSEDGRWSTSRRLLQLRTGVGVHHASEIKLPITVQPFDLPQRDEVERRADYRSDGGQVPPLAPRGCPLQPMLLALRVDERDRFATPVRSHEVLLEPRHPEDDIVAAEVRDVEVDAVGVRTDAHWRSTRDAACVLWLAIGEAGCAGRSSSQRQLRARGELRRDEVASGSAVDEDDSRAGADEPSELDERAAGWRHTRGDLSDRSTRYANGVVPLPQPAPGRTAVGGARNGCLDHVVAVRGGDRRQSMEAGGRGRRTIGAGIMAGIGEKVFVPEQREAIRCGDLLGRAY